MLWVIDGLIGRCSISVVAVMCRVGLLCRWESWFSPKYDACSVRYSYLVFLGISKSFWLFVQYYIKPNKITVLTFCSPNHFFGFQTELTNNSTLLLDLEQKTKGKLFCVSLMNIVGYSMTQLHWTRWCCCFILNIHGMIQSNCLQLVSVETA